MFQRRINLNEKEDQLKSFPGKKEMELSLQRLEKDLQEARQERDKALQEMICLKKHLLDRESKESEKMDEDSKIIEELRRDNEFQRSHHLEKSLEQSTKSQLEIKLVKNKEVQKAKEVVDELNKKLASLTSRLASKDVELENLQYALGQCCAEIEAKEADQKAEILRREKEEVLVKLSHAETMLVKEKNKVSKAEEDNTKLRCTLEQTETGALWSIYL